MAETTRRRFLGLFGVGAVPVAALASASAPPAQVYTRPAVMCPHCGRHMAIVTRRRNRTSELDAMVWSCLPCHRSWRVPVTPVEAEPVAYDNGMPRG